MDRIEQFLAMYAENTQRVYRSHLNNFFDAIDSDPESYFTEERDHEADLKQFYVNLKNGNRPPKSIKSSLHAVKSFFIDNDIEPSRRFWKRLMNRIQGSRAVTKARVPRPSDLKKILQHGDLRARALFLLLSSSGMRIGEALQLHVDDIDLSHEPTKIWIRGETTKTGNPRTTFMSKEATEALETWLNQRDYYLEHAASKSHFSPKSTSDPRIFPFDYNTARSCWVRLIEKAGYGDRDPRTNRYKMRIHNLRKFFRTRMSTAIDADIVEALMGHERELTSVYRRYGEDKLAEEYRKGEQKIVVFQTPLDTQQINKKLNNLKLENYELRKDLNRVMDLLNREIEPTDKIPRYMQLPDGTYQKVALDREQRKLELTGPKLTEEEYLQMAEGILREQDKQFWEDHEPPR